MDKLLVPFITILGVQQRVEYEGLHLIFFGCGKYGHREDGCPEQGQRSVAALVEQPARQPSGEEATFGLWMLLKYSRRQSSSQGGRQGASRVPIADYHPAGSANGTITPMGQDPPSESGLKAKEGSHPKGVPASPTRHRETNKGKSVTQEVHKSRFAVLGELGQEGDMDMDNDLAKLKQKIQTVSGPNSIAGVGQAHERSKVI